jgi:hypothetical protein
MKRGIFCWKSLDEWLRMLDVSRTSSKGMSKTPWAQGGPRSDTRDLWRRWWEGPSDPSVGEGPRRWERLPPTGIRSHEVCVAHGVRILECSRKPHLEVWARRYANLNGDQQWPGSGSRECKGLNRHNFLNICPNGASEVCIDIYVKRRCQ